MNFDLPDEPDAFLTTTNNPSSAPAAAAAAAEAAPVQSAAAGEPFNMLVDLSLVGDSFLGFDGHDVLELQSFDVSMPLGQGLHAYPNYSASAVSQSPFNAAFKSDSSANSSPERSGGNNNSIQGLFTISTSASPRENHAVRGAKAPHHAGVHNGGGGGGGAASASSPPQQSVETTTTTTANTSASTEEDRRKRHNANERKRTNALKTRILDMRDELTLLEKQRERLQEKGAAMIATQSSESALSTATTNKGFMEIVATIDRLRSEKSQLKRQVQQWDMQNSTYQTIVTEFKGGVKRKKPKQRLENGAAVASRGAAAGASSDEEEEEDDGEDAMNSEDAPIFQKILFAKPMALQDAMECVRSSYNEIMAFRNQSDFDSLGGEVLGWRDKRVLDKQSLQFMLAQHFESVLAEELVYKTWNLLTIMKMYQRIQPRTTELKTLQRVNSDCVIVRLSVGSGDQTHHTILLVARGRIDGGYLITYRSIPLSEGKARFAETEGTYVSIFNWFMFLDSQSPATGAPACEVIFGGKVKNRSAEYLRYLMMEVVAGVVRWQTAVGHSKFRLTN